MCVDSYGEQVSALRSGEMRRCTESQLSDFMAESWMSSPHLIDLEGQGGARSSCSCNLPYVAAARLKLRVTTEMCYFSTFCRSGTTIKAFVSVNVPILATRRMEISKLDRS
jgi:hypothetical protein